MFSWVTASRSCQLQQMQSTRGKNRICSAVKDYIDHPLSQISLLSLNLNFTTHLEKTAYYFATPTGIWKRQVAFLQWLYCKKVAMSR